MSKDRQLSYNCIAFPPVWLVTCWEVSQGMKRPASGTCGIGYRREITGGFFERNKLRYLCSGNNPEGDNV
jgi:hypothetical protein